MVNEKRIEMTRSVYDWALAATKFVATMKLDSCTNLESVEHVNKQLDLYYQENPPLEPSAFQEAMDLAAKLKNTKLQETLAMAKIRYEETQKLLKARQDAVTFAREQILNEYGSRRCSRKLLSSVSQCSLDKIDEELSDNEAIVKPVLSAVTPCGYMPSISPAMTADGGGGNGGGGSFVARSWNPIRRISSPNVASPLWDPMRRKSSYSAAEECTIQEPLTSIPKNLLGSKGSLHSSSNREEHDASNRVPDDMRSHSSGSSLLSGQKVHMRRSTSMFDRKTLCTLPSEAKTCRKLPLGSMESLNSSLQDDLDWSPATAVSGPVRPCRRAGTLPLGGSLKDLKVNEAEPKNKRALQLVMNELIQTEKGYVKSLEYIIVNYIPELVKDYLPQALRGKRNVVFGNIEKIYEFHSQYFLKELDICQNSPFMVAHAFLRHENEFHLYALYNKNKPKSDSLMCEYGTEFFRKKQMELADRMDLGSYLLKPVQRMGKYALLLKQILKECPEGSPEYNDLQAAEQMVKFQLRHGNDLLAMDCLRECDINLAEQGRVIRQDQFIVWQRGSRRKCVRQIFLFQEMVLFSKARVCENGKEYYIYRSSIKTSDIGLTERIGDSDTKFEIWFRRYNGGANYILQALNPDVRNTWVAEIANILWKQAVKNRERRMTEMCSMGIGHKPFIDIKPSIDQIHDRSIPLSLRTARSRNSIAVPSYEHHTRSNKKRPHSIISLSSTSSSNSSSQSSGFSVFGSVSLHAEESFANRKSVTLSSNESGIVPDITNESADHSYHRFGTHGLLSSVISDSMTTLTPESHSSQTSHNSLVAPLVTDVSL